MFKCEILTKILKFCGNTNIWYHNKCRFRTLLTVTGWICYCFQCWHSYAFREMIANINLNNCTASPAVPNQLIKKFKKCIFIFIWALNTINSEQSKLVILINYQMMKKAHSVVGIGSLSFYTVWLKVFCRDIANQWDPIPVWYFV